MWPSRISKLVLARAIRRQHQAIWAPRFFCAVSKEVPPSNQTEAISVTSETKLNEPVVPVDPSSKPEQIQQTLGEVAPELGTPIDHSTLKDDGVKTMEHLTAEVPEAPPEGRTLGRDMLLFMAVCAAGGFAWSKYKQWRDTYPKEISETLSEAKAHIVKAGREIPGDIRMWHLAQAESRTRKGLLLLLMSLNATSTDMSASEQELHRRVLTDSLTQKDNPSVMSLHCQLGRLCYDQKKYKMASDYYVLVLKSLSQQFGFDSLELIMPCRHLSDCFKELGQFSLSEHFLERALKIPAPGSEEQGQIQEQFSILYRRQGLWKKSIEYSNKALENARKNMGTAHSQVAAVLTGRSMAQIESGDLTAAMEGAELALGIVNTQQTPVPALKFNVLYVYGRALGALGKIHEAKSMFDAALSLSLEFKDQTKQQAVLNQMKLLSAPPAEIPSDNSPALTTV